jgi:hypothetical protein
MKNVKEERELHRMNKDDIKAIFNGGRTTDVDPKIERNIFKYGIITGSYGFFGGDHTDHFDVDVILMADEEKGFTVGQLAGGGTGFYTGNDYYGEKFASLYIKTKRFGNTPVNLIICNYEEEFERWKLANSVFQSLIKASKLFRERCRTRKTFRVDLFELCKRLKGDD